MSYSRRRPVSDLVQIRLWIVTRMTAFPFLRACACVRACVCACMRVESQTPPALSYHVSRCGASPTRITAMAMSAVCYYCNVFSPLWQARFALPWPTLVFASTWLPRMCSHPATSTRRTRFGFLNLDFWLRLPVSVQAFPHFLSISFLPYQECMRSASWLP